MKNAKTTPIQPDDSQQSKPNSPAKPNNLTHLNVDSGTKELNARLEHMENTLKYLHDQLDSSYQNLHLEFEQGMSDVQVKMNDNLQKNNEAIQADSQETREKLSSLEHSYFSLEQKSESLAQETARLLLELDKSTQQQTDALDKLEQGTDEKFDEISQEIISLDQQITQLLEDYLALKKESDALMNDLSVQTSALQKDFTDHQGSFKKLAQEIAERNKTIDERLTQVGENFSFHDQKIMKLHEKDTELEEKNESLKGLLEETEKENKQTFANLETDFDTKITAVSETAEQHHQTLAADQAELEQRTSNLENKSEQLDSQTDQLEQKTDQIDEKLDTVNQTHSQQLSVQEEKIATHNANLYTHENRLHQLHQVDQELSARAQGLKETTDRLNQHSQALENTTIALQEQSHDLQDAVSLLNDQNEKLEDKTEQLGTQIAINSQKERQHFQTLSIALLVVAILTVLGLVYALINQQSLWQSSMENDVAIENRINVELSEHSTRLMLAEMNRKELTQKVSALQEQLKAEQSLSEDLVKADLHKHKQITELNKEVKNMDDNVQFLNASVGPLRDYSYYSGKQAVKDPKWLAQQSAEQYSIQLTSVDSKQKMYQFIDQYGHSMTEQLAWFSINSKGKDHYILTYGTFDDIINARAALANLPRIVVEQSPGISRLKDIQQFIKL